MHARTNAPRQASLNRGNVLRQVVAVQAKACLQAQAVASPQACGARYANRQRQQAPSNEALLGAPARWTAPVAISFSVSATARSFGTLISKPSSPV